MHVQQHHTQTPAVSTVALKAVSLPRYEVAYTNLEQAYRDGRALQQRTPMQLGCAFREPPGTQIVIDLVVQGYSMTTTFLFRIVHKMDKVSIVDWVPRRKTDPDLMGLWIDSLKGALTGEEPTQTPKPEAVPIDGKTQQKLLDLCRRTLSPNPFTVLNVHWSCTPADIRKAVSNTRDFLQKYEGHGGLNERLQKFVPQAIARVSAVESQLSELEHRHKARKKFIPKHQLEHALELARNRYEVALMRRQQNELRRLKVELIELMM